MLKILLITLLCGVVAFCATYCHSEHGLIESDPYFKGFQGQRFRFDGRVGGIYHLFSDPYVSINTKFGVANAAKKQGTVINQVGMKLVDLELVVSLDSFASNDTCNVIINSESVELNAQTPEVQFGGCNKITYNNYVLKVQTTMHEFTLTKGTEKTRHIDQDYINIAFDQSFENVHLFGGVLGQTAVANAVISREEADFESSTLFSVDAKTDKYLATAIDCNRQRGLTSQHSTRSPGSNLCDADQYCTGDDGDTESFVCNSNTCFADGQGCPTEAECDADSGSPTNGNCLLKYDEECAQDISCYDGHCISGHCGCLADDDCSGSEVCSSDHQCVSPPSDGSCSAADRFDCDSSDPIVSCKTTCYCFWDIETDGSFCGQDSSCGATCASHADCGANEKCSPHTCCGGRSICVPIC